MKCLTSKFFLSLKSSFIFFWVENWSVIGHSFLLIKFEVWNFLRNEKIWKFLKNFLFNTYWQKQLGPEIISNNFLINYWLMKCYIRSSLFNTYFSKSKSSGYFFIKYITTVYLIFYGIYALSIIFFNYFNSIRSHTLPMLLTISFNLN